MAGNGSAVWVVPHISCWLLLDIKLQIFTVFFLLTVKSGITYTVLLESVAPTGGRQRVRWNGFLPLIRL